MKGDHFYEVMSEKEATSSIAGLHLKGWRVMEEKRNQEERRKIRG